MGVNLKEWALATGQAEIPDEGWIALLQLMRPVGRCVGCGKPLYAGNHVVNGWMMAHTQCLSFMAFTIGAVEEVEA